MSDNLDVVFWGVEYVSLPTRMNGIVIRIQGRGEDRGTSIGEATVSSHLRVFLVDSGQRHGYVVAGGCKVLSNQMSLFDSSLVDPNRDRRKEDYGHVLAKVPDVPDVTEWKRSEDVYPGKSELTHAIEVAAEAAIRQLFARYPTHHFYYLSLITTGEALPPVLAAWSWEALEDAVAKEPDKEDARWGLKWSYADSPFLGFGDECFAEVNALFRERPDCHLSEDEDYSGSACEAECRLRLDAMEVAMSNLDRKELFGAGKERLAIVVNVEVMPPDFSNTERAMRLNPPEAIRAWLEEAAEPE